MKSISLLSLLCLLLALNTQAQKKKIAANASTSSLSYALVHTLHSFDAKAKTFKSVISYDESTKKIDAIAVIVQIRDFDSDNSNRDSHMIEVLEALKYPTVTFSASDIKYEGNKVKASGKLTFHGVSKNIEITGIETKDSKQLSLSGNFTVDMTDYGVEQPSIMAMKTEKEIKLSFKINYPL